MWSKTSEGFPKDEYILTYNNENGELHIAWCDDEGYWWSDYGIVEEPPTHWQRIEELPD